MIRWEPCKCSRCGRTFLVAKGGVIERHDFDLFPLCSSCKIKKLANAFKKK